VLNDRLRRFHEAEIKGIDTAVPISSLLVIELDKDGRADLVATRAGGRAFACRNATEWTAQPRAIVGEPWPIDTGDRASAVAADLDLDSWPAGRWCLASARSRRPPCSGSAGPTAPCNAS
jgi:hypothetical protein